MRKITVLLLSAIMAFTACSRKQPREFMLEGTVWNGASDSILVVGMDSRFDRVDTIRMHDGQFSYSCSLDTIVPLLLVFPDGRTEVVFGDKFQSSTFVIDSLGKASVSGGVANGQYAEFLEMIAQDTCQKDIEEHIDSFIVRYPISEVSPYIIYRYCMDDEDYKGQRIRNHVDRMGGLMRDNVYLSEVYARATSQASALTTFDNIALKDTAGVDTLLSGLCSDGYTLICLWASWDTLSRNVMDSVPVLKKDYKKKNLTIIGISVDSSFDRFKAAVTEDSTDIAQYVDLSGPGGRLASKLDRDRVPLYILINNQRRVLLKTTSVKTMRSRLNTTLEDKKPEKKKSGSKTKAKPVS